MKPQKVKPKTIRAMDKAKADAMRRLYLRLDDLLRAGQMCSNVCYNLAQRTKLADDARSMTKGYQEWEKAAREMRCVMPPLTPYPKSK